MKKPSKLATAILLAVAANTTYAEEKCFPPTENRETIVEVLTCFQKGLDTLAAENQKQQATINTQQKQIA